MERAHISSAPLLYISSNPSISEDEDYPRMDWPEELIQDFFWNRFGGGIKEWVRDGNQARISDGEYLRSTPYWSEIKNRSGELLGRSVIPGVDYAITEIVHCKSRNNIGVDDAMEECVSKFFHSVLKVSGARVLISVGKKVERSMKVTFNLDQAARIIGPIWIAGQERFVLFFAAPNSNQPRKVDKVLTHSEIARIRSYLMDAPF